MACVAGALVALVDRTVLAVVDGSVVALVEHAIVAVVEIRLLAVIEGMFLTGLFRPECSDSGCSRGDGTLVDNWGMGTAYCIYLYSVYSYVSRWLC